VNSENNKRAKRGLGALLGTEISIDGKKVSVLSVEIEKIKFSRFQPRTVINDEKLDELKESILSQGIIQPLIVRQTAGGGYELIAGERRLRAARLAGLEQAPVVVKEVSDEEINKIGLIENLQREDLNPIDEARGIQRLQKEFNLTQDDLGKSLGKSRAAVANSIRLLQLSKEVQDLLQGGVLNMGHARPLLSLPEGIQESFAKKISKNGLSVRQTEALVNSYQSQKNRKVTSKKDPNLLNLENELSDHLGSSVTISHKKNGSGKITFVYKNLEKLDSIIKPLKKEQ
jgi:ParB family chromosome partitioning protein